MNMYSRGLGLFLGVVLFSSFKVDPDFETKLYCYMKGIGIKNADVVLKQAIFESGHFNSKIYKAKHNLFGFRRTKTYITYKNWQACVDYYKIWQDKYYKDASQDYYSFLQKINYTGYKKFDYAKALKNIKTRGSLKCD